MGLLHSTSVWQRQPLFLQCFHAFGSVGGLQPFCGTIGAISRVLSDECVSTKPTVKIYAAPSKSCMTRWISCEIIRAKASLFFVERFDVQVVKRAPVASFHRKTQRYMPPCRYFSHGPSNVKDKKSVFSNQRRRLSPRLDGTFPFRI